MKRALIFVDVCVLIVAFVFLTVYIVNGNFVCHLIWWVLFGIHLVMKCCGLAFEHRKKK